MRCKENTIFFVPVFMEVTECEMTDITEQCVYMKFYTKLGQTATETYKMLKSALGQGLSATL
jgi:hypothetical protein